MSRLSRTFTVLLAALFLVVWPILVRDHVLVQSAPAECCYAYDTTSTLPGQYTLTLTSAPRVRTRADEAQRLRMFLKKNVRILEYAVLEGVQGSASCAPIRDDGGEVEVSGAPFESAAECGVLGGSGRVGLEFLVLVGKGEGERDVEVDEVFLNTKKCAKTSHEVCVPPELDTSGYISVGQHGTLIPIWALALALGAALALLLGLALLAYSKSRTTDKHGSQPHDGNEDEKHDRGRREKRVRRARRGGFWKYLYPVEWERREWERDRGKGAALGGGLRGENMARGEREREEGGKVKVAAVGPLGSREKVGATAASAGGGGGGTSTGILARTRPKAPSPLSSQPLTASPLSPAPPPLHSRHAPQDLPAPSRSNSGIIPVPNCSEKTGSPSSSATGCQPGAFPAGQSGQGQVHRHVLSKPNPNPSPNSKLKSKSNPDTTTTTTSPSSQSSSPPTRDPALTPNRTSLLPATKHARIQTWTEDIAKLRTDTHLARQSLVPHTASTTSHTAVPAATVPTTTVPTARKTSLDTQDEDLPLAFITPHPGWKRQAEPLSVVRDDENVPLGLCYRAVSPVAASASSGAGAGGGGKLGRQSVMLEDDDHVPLGARKPTPPPPPQSPPLSQTLQQE